MIALIDGDILLYRVGFTTQEEEEFVAEARLKSFIEDILLNVETEHYNIFLTSQDKSNFRYTINPGYKANRKADKPIHYHFLRDIMIEQWNASEVFGEEADDALAQHQTEDSIICTIDKDLNQIVGWHYNFVTKEKYYVTEEDGLKWFYKQMLIGDAVDNIKGIDGIGPKKADKLIDPLTRECDMYSTVANLYKDLDRFDMNADCLWILRNENERFTNRVINELD